MKIDEIQKLTSNEVRDKILEIKSKLGKRLVILGHHYQRDEIVDISDFNGDSFELCKKAAAQSEAEFIVFCGVHFMAEAADIITSPEQIVQIPDKTAGCPLADFADIDLVTSAWQEIESVVGLNFGIPVTYVNSSAAIKAFCGQKNGVVCTSSNAVKAFTWGFNQAEKLFFFPDQNLGVNTGNKLNISPEKIIIWDPLLPFGGNTKEEIMNARLILWKGHCHVHTKFSITHIESARKQFPDCEIIVHPECKQEVVNASDENGSTSEIIKFVEHSKPNSTIVIGTEFNLVQRLAMRTKDKKILPLTQSVCPNMHKINLYNLFWTLSNIGQVNIVKVPTDIRASATKALNQMLNLS